MFGMNPTMLGTIWTNAPLATLGACALPESGMTQPPFLVLRRQRPSFLGELAIEPVHDVLERHRRAIASRHEQRRERGLLDLRARHVAGIRHRRDRFRQ